MNYPHFTEAGLTVIIALIGVHWWSLQGQLKQLRQEIKGIKSDFVHKDVYDLMHKNISRSLVTIEKFLDKLANGERINKLEKRIAELEKER